MDGRPSVIRYAPGSSWSVRHRQPSHERYTVLPANARTGTIQSSTSRRGFERRAESNRPNLSNGFPATNNGLNCMAAQRVMVQFWQNNVTHGFRVGISTVQPRRNVYSPVPLGPINLPAVLPRAQEIFQQDYRRPVERVPTLEELALSREIADSFGPDGLKEEIKQEVTEEDRMMFQRILRNELICGICMIHAKLYKCSACLYGLCKYCKSTISSQYLGNVICPYCRQRQNEFKLIELPRF